LSLFLASLLSSCVGLRYLESNESIVIQQPEIHGVPNKDKEAMKDLVVLQPNKRLFGALPFSYLVYAYHTGEKKFNPDKYQNKIDKINSRYDQKISTAEKPERKNKLLNKKTAKVDEIKQTLREGNWLMKIGEPLALFDDSKISISQSRLETYLIAHGYFDGTISHEILQKGDEKKYVSYTISAGTRYKIDSIQWVINDPEVLTLMKEQSSKRIIKKGQPYQQEALENERNRIYDLMTNSGYYTFSRQYIGFEIDTFSLASNNILLKERISNPNLIPHRRFTIDSVVFYSGKPGSSTQSQFTDAKGNSYRFSDRNYNTRILQERISIEKDSLYSRASTIKTQQQLSYLDAFRFVNINYDSINDHQLIANIFTNPLNRYQTSFEFGGVSASQIPGPFVNIGLKNRNTFHSMEIIDLQGSFSLQGLSNVRTDSSTFSLFQYGGSASVTFPRFMLPLPTKLQQNIRSLNPQTRFRFSYNYEFRYDGEEREIEYERSRAELNLSYLWASDSRSQYTFAPLTFSFIDTKNLGNEFRDLLDSLQQIGNGALKAAFNSSVISSTSFEALHNFNTNQSIGENAFIRLFAETGGNIINLLGEDFFLRTNNVSADEFSLFQWTKFIADYRRVHLLNNSAHLAYRINFGLAYPYGKDPSLPYEKRFYVGGSNSLRAWQIRRLGPGSYGIIDSKTEGSQQVAIINYQLEQGGDMVLESSIEYRKKLIGFIDYAFFIDAGNIWLVNSNFNLNDAQGDDGFFRINSFYKELAVGAGMGLRLDFSFFVFRLDGAVQLHDPAQRPGNRWVIGDIPFGKIGKLSPTEKNILKNKTNITLGIGLPF
jgi:outer membrane protein insertion porin family